MNTVVALCFLLLTTAHAAPGLDVSRFSMRALATFEFSIRYSDLFPKTEKTEAFDQHLTALSTPVAYTGVSRPLPELKKAFITRLAHEVLKQDEVAALYTREIEVEETGLKYWIAVQNDVFPHFEKELKPGAPMRIYFHFAGVARGKQPVYLLVEFDSAVSKNRHN